MHWPPVVGKTATLRAAGVVEIFFVWDPAKKTYAGCLRWLGKATFAGGSGPWPVFKGALATLPYVHAFSDSQLNEAFAAAMDGELVYRFDESGKHVSKGERLRFEGITVLEQYALPVKDGAETGAQACQMRIPLLGEYRIGGAGGQVHTSAIQIGHRNHPSLRLNLGLRLPAPMTETQREHDTPVLSFSALYAAQLDDLPAIGTALVYNNLNYGPPGANVEVALEDGTLADIRFARYGDTRGYAIPEPTTNWPTSRTILTGVLRTLGIRFAGTDPDARFTVVTPYARSSPLIRMPSVTLRALAPQGTEAPRYLLRQCFAIRTEPGAQGAISEDKSDIRVRGGKFQVRAPGGGHRWLSLGKTIYIVIEVEGVIASVFAAQPEMTVGVRIGWSEALETLAATSELLRPAAAIEDGAGVGELLGASFASMRLAHAGLRHLSPRQPQSLLPEVSLAPGLAEQRRYFAMFAKYQDVRLDEHGKFPVAAADGLAIDAFRASLETADVLANPAKAEDHVRLRLTASWPSFHYETSANNTRHALVLVHEAQAFGTRRHTGAQRLEAQDHLVWVAIEELATAARELYSNLGGMIFFQSGTSVLYAAPDAATQPSTLRVGARAPLDLGLQPGHPLATGNLTLKLVFSINSATPAGVDIERGDRSLRPGPVLLQEQPGGVPAAEARYYLAITESISEDNDWRLTAQLNENEQWRADVKTVLFSEQPFAVHRFWSSPLGSLGGTDTTIVGTYDSDKGNWEVRRDGRSYHYVLPPQSVGESMDKPRRLELHDADPKDLAAHGYLSPVPPGDAALRRYPVEFRLTPPAELWIAPTDVERNYFAPPWASARIFRQKSELGVGAALTALRAEFVYGLPVSVTPAAERGPARRARVAEIEALIGHPMTANAESREEREVHWKRVRSVLARRPERLEVWADDPSSTLAFAPARFADSARFCLRQTALHRPAVPAADLVPVDGMTWPRQQVRDASPRLHPRGLAGGALWPIESFNVLNMVVSAPAAQGGAIEQIALSAHGGDAEQDARFCNGIVAVITSTRSGFVHRQKVEVLGRIGVFWHRAKHVVIYERTVNPSAQFTPEGGLGSRTRRPVLRKISEYIEILQPERRYPDMPGAALHTCGFLRGVRFNSQIIPVDSAWAEDVGTIGWQIPLWNRHAAQVRPQVYVRPDTAFVTAAEGKEKDAETAQECLNPDNLYFFSDTTNVDDRTDLWKARLGIDFTNLPAPCHDWPASQRTGDPTGADDGGNAARVPPGFARFTWLLAPPAQRTTINAGRAEQPVYTALESITFMRGGGAQAATPVAPDDPLMIGAALANAAPAPLFSGPWMKASALPAGGPLTDFSEKLAAASTALRAGFSADPIKQTELKTIMDTLGTAAGAVQVGELPTELGKISAAYKATLGVFGDGLKKVEDGLPDYCATMKTNLSAALGAKRLAMVQEMRAWEAQTQARIAATPEVFETALASEQMLLAFLEEEMADFLMPVFSGTEFEVGKLRRGIESARSAIADVRAEIVARIEGSLARLQAVRKAMDLEKPWSQARMAQFGAQLDDVLRRAFEAISAAVRDARRRLATELDDLSRRVGTAAARALDGIDAGQRALDAWLALNGKLEAQVGALVDALQMQPQGIGKLAGDARAALEKARKDQPGQTAKIDAILAGIDDFTSLVNNSTTYAADLGTVLVHAGRTISKEAMQAADRVRALAGVAGSPIRAILDQLKTDLDGVQGDIVEEVRTAIDALRLPLQETLAQVLALLANGGSWIDAVIAITVERITQESARCVEVINTAGTVIDEVAEHSLDAVREVEMALAPAPLVGAIVGIVLDDARVGRLMQELVQTLAVLQGTAQWKLAAGAALGEIVDEAVGIVEKPFSLGGDYLNGLDEACRRFAGGIRNIRNQLTAEVAEILEPLRASLEKYQAEVMNGLEEALGDPAKYAELVRKFDGFDRDVRVIGSDLASSGQKAQAYGERVVDAIGNIGAGGLDAAPGNILKAFAAAGDPPTMPNLDFAKERLAYYLGAVNDVVDITPVTARFGALAEGLASMGLNAPCDRIGNWLETMDLSRLDIGAVIDKFAGCELGKLLKGQTFASPMRDAIRITHDFDQKRARAWVCIDVNVPLDGRHPLFSVGPFSLDLLDANLVGQVRLEAAADSDKVEQSGSATITTAFDAVVGGQSMVTLNKVELRYDKSGSLKVDFDPKNLKLNPTFQFIQNTLQSIVGDEFGGLKIVKRDGIPVGVEHLFSMPPMNLMFGTSGVQNLQIANQFQLLAYPDFMIANRFSLARPDLPFIFSVFIIGGTGWLTVDCEYRPFTNELLVVVEAGAGGSASLGFGFAGCTGSVAITISVALTYRKLIGKPGGGLTVALVVLIVGTIDVLCIANATLSLLLRLSYRENGDIDASGTFRLKVRISRFFEVSAGGEARYAMRGGKSESSSSTSSDYKLSADSLKKAKKLIDGQKG
ncbi:hypothetical protein ACHAC9_00760 [Massilia sp. CMS3.1]|uniref:hypothetical protein n=1 Tax=Massilia sp. CMS3.1 TaxID=3373083 RepID=UPI003EE5CBFB